MTQTINTQTHGQITTDTTWKKQRITIEHSYSDGTFKSNDFVRNVHFARLDDDGNVIGCCVIDFEGHELKHLYDDVWIVRYNHRPSRSVEIKRELGTI